MERAAVMTGVELHAYDSAKKFFVESLGIDPEKLLLSYFQFRNNKTENLY